MEKIILASASPRRKELLGNIGLSFSVLVPDADEDSIPKNIAPPLYVQELALLKASAAAALLPEGGKKDRIIIAADTIVCLDGKILGKPADKAEAEAMLTALSDRVHTVYTGFCVMRAKDAFAVCRSEKTQVRFQALSPEKIRRYIATGEPMDKAGAYGIQGYGATLVSGIDGDYFNVVGLPVAALAAVLEQEFGIEIF